MSTGSLLRLLSDDTRLRILHLLGEEPLTVAELQELLDCSQSSASGHLGRLKRAGFLHDQAEGSAHRYRLREDLEPAVLATWQAVRDLSRSDPAIRADLGHLEELRSRRGRSWVDQVAGSLHRAYAPGRTWEALAHAFLACASFGRCVDVGAGDGAMAALLAPRCSSLLCVDPAPAMVAAAEGRIAEQGLSNTQAVQAGAQALPLADGEADTVLFLQSLQYIPDPAAALCEAARVLAPGGRLLVLTLVSHHAAEAKRYGHLHLGFSPRQLRGWCEGLELDLCQELPAESRPPRFRPLLLVARCGG